MRGCGWVLLALAAGCGRADEAPSGPAVIFKESPYYPLQVGASWVYREGAGTVVSRVARRENFGGIDCAAVETEREGKRVATEHWFATEKGLYWAGVDRRRLAPPLLMLKLPPKTGESWQTNLREGKAQDRVQQAVFRQDEEEVTVPAGTYRSVRLQGEVTEGPVRRQAFTYWFAPKVGIVKKVIRHGDEQRTYEMVKYDPGK